MVREKFFLLLIFLLSVTAEAQNHKGMTFQGYIKTPGGVPLTVAGVSVSLKVLSPNECVLLDEVHTGVNISDGFLNLVLGKGTRTGTDEGFTFKQVFDNLTTRNALDPATGPAGSCNYVPAVDRQDSRKLRVYFMNGGDAIQADFNIRGAAFAVSSEDSELLGGKASSEFIQTTTDVTQARTNALFAPEVYNNLLNVGTTNTGAFTLPVGTTGQQPGSPTAGMIRFNDTIDQVEFYNGTTWTTMSSGGGSVSSVTSANLYLTVATGTTTPSLTVNVGTAANTVAAGNDSRIVNAIQNAGFTPSIKTGAEGSQGAAGTLGQLYIASNSSKIYRDNGSSWDLLFPALSGDVTSSIGTVTTTVTKLRGVSIGTTAPADLQVLKYDNGTTSWLANYMAITDLRSTVNPAANPLFSSYSCTSNQTLTWNAPTGQLGCTNIASLDATAISAGTISPARLGIGTADATTFLRGDGTWASPGGGGSGDVVGPASATDNAIVRYDGTTGKLVQNSGVVIDDTGRVGIGTATPSHKLEVSNSGAATVYITDTSAQTGYLRLGSHNIEFAPKVAGNIVTIKGDMNDWADVFKITSAAGPNANATTYMYGKQEFQTYTDVLNAFQVKNAAGTTQFNIDTTTGNVGIGTTAPSSKLHVMGSLKIVDGTQGNGKVLTSDANGVASWQAAGGSSQWTTSGSDIYYTTGKVGIGSTNPATPLDVVGNISLSGKLGIGTANPSQNFSIVDSSGGDASIRVKSIGNEAIIKLEGFSGTYNWSIATTSGGNFGLRETGWAAQNYLTAEAGWSGTTPITIRSTGRVGISLASPGYPLDVTGDINSSTSLRVAGTQICTSAGCTSSSDLRLKENVQNLENSLQNILKLQGVTYDWINKEKYSSSQQVGLIAQDVQKIYPQVVRQDPQSGYLSIAYDHLVAPLIESVKALYLRVTRLDRRIQSLEKENAALKKYLCDKDPMAPICP